MPPAPDTDRDDRRDPVVSRERRVDRRSWLAGAATAAVVAGLSRPGRAAAPAEASDLAQPPEPLPRILLAGDSMIAGGLGLFLERELRKDFGYPVLRSGKTSSGLSRPDFFDWMVQAQSVVAEFEPEASIVMFGGNDVQGLYMQRDRAARAANAPKWIRFPDERAWSDEYARRVSRFCDILAPQGQPIFWVGMPVMRPPTFHEKIKRVNVIYRAEMAIRRNATFIDIWDLLSDGTGEYAHKIALEPAPEGKKAKRVRVRAGDGIHLSPAGAHVVADHVKAIVHGALASPPTK